MSDDAEYRATFKRTVDREFGAIRRVLEGLRNLARPIPLERFSIDVNRSVSEVVESMEPQSRVAGVTLVAEPSSQAPKLEGDLFALSRVYRNLITNAFQATPPNGRGVDVARRPDPAGPLACHEVDLAHPRDGG